MYKQEEAAANGSETSVVNVRTRCSAATWTRSCEEKAKALDGGFSSPGRIVDGSQGSLSLKITSVTADSPTLDLTHLHVLLLF